MASVPRGIASPPHKTDIFGPKSGQTEGWPLCREQFLAKKGQP